MTPPERAPGLAGGGAGWRRPRVEVSGLRRYVQTLQERRNLVLLTVAATTLIAILYVAMAAKVYESEADLLITPASSDDPVLTGLGIIRESSDPTRDVETASRLVTSRNVGQAVKTKLRLSDDVDAVTAKVTAVPVAQSNIVSITAKADDPDLARNLANGFADGVVAERSADLRRQVRPLIRRTQQRIAAGQDTTTNQGSAGNLSDQLATLQALETGGDPTLRVQARAVAEDSPVAPRPVITILAAIIGGLVIGVGGAFALQALDPRLRREDQLRELYSLPVLARIPKERKARTFKLGSRRLGLGPRRKRRLALGPSQLSPRTLEAYRTLRTMLTMSREPAHDHGQAVLVTGPSPSEGKTTTAVNLASSLALAGKRVILIESDFRRPTMGEALGVKARSGIGKVLFGSVPLEEALVPVKPFGDSLRVLPVERADDWLTELLSLPAAQDLLANARRLADVVIVDSPPLTEVVDALPLARHVDDVVIVCRLGSSNLGQLSRLGDLLEQNGIVPAGFVIVGVGSSEEESYYLSSRRERMRGFEDEVSDGDLAAVPERIER